MNNETELFAEAFYWRQTVTSEQPSPYSVSFLATDQAFPGKEFYPALILQPTNPAYVSERGTTFGWHRVRRTAGLG